MSFKDQVAKDVHGVFLNLGEFAEKRNLIYDGVLYENISVVITQLKEEDRNRLTTGLKESGGRSSYADHVVGLYKQYRVLHLAQSDINDGRILEKGMKLSISETEGGTFFRDYTITASGLDMGMMRVEIEMVDE